MTLDSDVLVIGSGIAGLTFALKVAPQRRVLLVTKKERADSNTNFARGGIAAGLGADDDPESHLRDTLAAGGGLCKREVVELVVREGPARVHELIDWGVRFHRERGELSLGMEGGHSRRRILHAGDRTGREIERALLAAAEEQGIEIVEHLLAVDLLVEQGATGDGPTCRGALALDYRRGERVELRAPVTFLATGGCGQVYGHTTNPAIATGDGVAMAYRAGARIANMEFIQFHPTALHPTEDPAFLLSEALRGEGAVLRRIDGSTFMERYDPRGSLAPRDVVARAIHRELQGSGDPHVLLDVRTISPERLKTRFPGTAEGCARRGIDPYEAGIPVIPAAHYVCGGVLTDTWARTNLPGLYAAGEVASTGVHGANRLASNSLLEAVVFSHRAADAVLGRGSGDARGSPEGARLPAGIPTGPPAAASGTGIPDAPGEGAASAEEGGGAPAREERAGAGFAPPMAAAHGRLRDVRASLRDLMWRRVGIVRSDADLGHAAEEVGALLAEEERSGERDRWSAEGVELRNLLLTATLIVECALRRKESRGLHFNVDHPERDDDRFGRDTVVEPPPRGPTVHSPFSAPGDGR